MKLLINIVLTAMLTFAFGLYLPWWSLAIAAFLVALAAGRSIGISIVGGFVGVFLLWGIMSWTISSGNEHILAHRMSQVILKKDNPLALVLVTAVLGGLLGAVSAWSGAALRKLFTNKND